MSGPALATRVAVDAGSLLARVAVSRGDGEPELYAQTAGGSEPDGLRSALTAIRARHGADVPVRVAVPDAWLDGADGVRRQEELRHIAEDEFGLTAVSWAGQLACVAALAASRRGSIQPGRYLVCDAGGTGVRVALCEVGGRTVRQVAVHDAPGGGWLGFDAAIRAELGAGSGLDGWDESARAQDKRARLVLGRVRTAPEFRDTRAYSLKGADGTHELTAGQAADCFAPTGERIRAGTEAVSGGDQVTTAVLAGGLAWFPLAAAALADALGRDEAGNDVLGGGAAGRDPVVLGPDAAARGALLLAAGHLTAAPPGMPPVRLPMHRVRNGLLEETSVRLPWEDQFAPAGDEPLTLAGPELTLDIGGRRTTLAVPGLAAGEYRVGVRPSWSGSAVLVLRADRVGGTGEADGTDRVGQNPARADVHVVPLDLQEMTDE